MMEDYTSTLPHDPDSEKATLGSLLIDSDRIHDLRLFLKVEDFFMPEHQQIYEAALKIIERGEPIDQTTVAHELAGKGKLPDIGGAAYLSHLISITPTSLHAKYYGQIVKNTAIRRQAIKFATNAAAIAYKEQDPKDVITEIEKGVLELQKSVALPHLITPMDLAKLGEQYYTELKDGKVPSLRTGFSELDWLTGGFYGGEYCLIAARPSVGKTSIMLTMAQHIGRNYGNVLLVSLEERWQQILNKLISERTGKHPRLIRAGNYSDEFYGDILFRLGDIAEQNIYFLDAGTSLYIEGTTTPTIYSIASHMKMAHGLTAIFIDYLGLIGDNYGKGSYERVTFISRRLKTMATSLNVPLFCLCQLSRQVEYRPEENRRPEMRDLRDSGALEQDADVILFLYRDDYYSDILLEQCTRPEGSKVSCWDCPNPCPLLGQAELILAKQRQGGAREVKMPLQWDAQHFRYIERKGNGK